WGFGRVTEWNLLLNQIVIDFASKKSHPMQVQYAAENLTPLAREHFLARKANNLTSIKTLAREEPVAVVRNIVESLGGQATVAQIGEWLVNDVLTEAEWKRWWESTNKLLKASVAFSIPAKNTEPIHLRAEGLSHTDELIASFNKARQPKEQIAALEQIIRFHEQFKEPEKQLQSFIATIENMAVRNQKMHPELAFEFIIARDSDIGFFKDVSKQLSIFNQRTVQLAGTAGVAVLFAFERRENSAEQFRCNQLAPALPSVTQPGEHLARGGMLADAPLEHCPKFGILSRLAQDARNLRDHATVTPLHQA